ncbi:MAG: NAD(P)/FAD-dependent oxidoreductase [Planctomycetota bacterium]|jgi:NADH dehydrogenase
MDERPRVVIVGGGFGGLAAARGLRRSRADVLLVDRRNHHLFQPLLYQVATAALSPANIAAPIRKILARQRNCEVVMGEVTSVDLAGRTVTIADTEQYAYDFLVLAAGVCTNYFGREEWARHAPGLKTIDEAIDIRCRFLLALEQAEIETDPAARRAALTFAIVGAGPTGVEMAGAVAEIGRQMLARDFRHLERDAMRVILIDAVDRVLPSFAPSLSARAERDLESMGVELRLGARVVDVDAHGFVLEGSGGAERVDAGNLIWAAGVRAVDLTDDLEVETDAGGRITVGDDLAIPGRAEVFVVGDLAHRVDPVSGQPVPGVAQGAMQMGRFVGRLIAAEIDAQQRGRPAPDRGIFVYRDKGSMATIGRNRAIAEIKGFRVAGRLAFVLWGLVHILFLIDFRQRFSTLAEWTWMYLFYDRGVRLITGEHGSPKPVRPPPDPRLRRKV